MKIGYPSWRRPLVNYGLWLIFAIFLYFYLHLFKNALIDDAFITLRYVKTLLSSGTWGFFPGTIANSATSPFNVALLTMVSLFTGPTTEAAVWLYSFCVLCIAFNVTRLSSLVSGSELYGWLAVVALVFNPLLISTAGLESIVLTTLFVSAMYYYQVQRWIGLAIILGLLTLTRMEGGLFFLIFLLFIPSSKTKLQIVVVYILCILPWYLFSWIHLGSLIPDTFFIKTEQGTWWQWDFFNGMTDLYYAVYPLETVLSFIFLPLVALLFIKKVRDVTILVITALAGGFHFIAYSLLRVPPFHWYYVPQVITIILVGSLGLGVVSRASNRFWQQIMLRSVTLVCFLVPILGMSYILGRDHFTVQEMPMHSNWGTLGQYKKIGLWLKANHQADVIRLVGGEIGTLSYYCDCRLVDRFSDRSWLKDYIAEHASGSGILPLLLRANFLFYSYTESPSNAYILSAYSSSPTTNAGIIKEWETTTKWVRRGFVILSRE